MKNFRICSALLISSLTLLSSCMKDDTSIEKMQEEEQRQIASYISTNNITVTPNASGLYIIPTVTGTGISPTEANYVLMNYRLLDINNKLLSTNDSAQAKANTSYIVSQFAGGPYKTSLGNLNLALQQGLLELKEGGKSTLVVPSSLWLNDYIPRVFELELVKVINDPIAFEKEQIGYFLDSISKQLNISTVLTIADSTKNDVSGIYYIETQKGTLGDSIIAGDTVTIDYTVNLISYKNIWGERRIDKGTNYKSVIFNAIASKSNIPGFDEGLRHMKKGGKGIVIIPYHRAYGKAGYVSSYINQIIIPEYSTLVYYIEVKDVK